MKRWAFLCLRLLSLSFDQPLYPRASKRLNPRSQRGTLDTCLPAKDQKKLDSIHNADDRLRVLAGIAKRQASRLRTYLILYQAHGTWDEQLPLGRGHGSGCEILYVQSCALSQLSEELSNWKPGSKRDAKTLQGLLQVTKRVDDTLVELGPEAESNFQPIMKKNLKAVRDVESAIGVLCNSCRSE